jgi:Ca2+-binding RTX toxin-like protein
LAAGSVLPQVSGSAPVPRSIAAFAPRPVLAVDTKVAKCFRRRVLFRPSQPARRLSRLSSVLILATWFLVAAPAIGAATVLVETSPGLGEVVYYTADAGEANELTITTSATGLHFEDPGAVITPGSGCTADSAHEVSCEAPSTAFLSVRVDDLDDFVSALARECCGATGIEAGSGNDVISGSDDDDGISGQGGDDLIWGNGGDNNIYGGPGDDRLLGGPELDFLFGEEGDDILSGGGGAADKVDYFFSSGPVVLTLDDRPGDGEAGENDDVRSDVENLTGGRFNDRLVGSPRPNGLNGVRGDDVLVSHGGRDTLLGGVGDDTFRPGPGRDRAEGSSGRDTFYARDGRRDRLRGGRGGDRAHIDPGLDVASSIEAFF